MRNNPIRTIGRVVLGAALFAIIPVTLFPVSHASAAGYPRRVAIAPFVSLTKEDIGSTVTVLPRLLASRLMALAGADVLLLPSGGKALDVAAKEAKYPLLLQGTVSKLGKGYSIDTTVTDLATGASAGAFFAAAATEDDIIAQLGVLSGEIAERMFGVQGAIRAVSPPPPPAAAPVAPSAGIAAVTSLPAAGVAAAVAAPAPATPPPHAPSTVAEGWIPSSLKKVGQSDKVADELYGVTMIDNIADGGVLVATWGRNVLHFYRVKGDQILPFSRITKESSVRFLNIEAADIDGDGRKEIIAACLVNDRIESSVYRKGSDAYVEVAGEIPFFLTVLPDWQGKRAVVGQARGLDFPFHGKLYEMAWDGKTFREGNPLPADTSIKPLEQGILGLSSGRFGNEWNLIYTDEEFYLRVLQPNGKSTYKSRIKYGAGIDLFEWGAVDRLEGKRKEFFVRKAPRVSTGAGDTPLLLAVEADKGILGLARYWDTTRVVLLQWDGSGFSEKAGDRKSENFHSGADFLSLPLRRGGGVIASMIEQEKSSFKAPVSRLVLYRAE